MSTPVATITEIGLAPDGTGVGINNTCTVVFSDVTTGYTQTKTYAFPSTQSILLDKAAIQTDLNLIKTAVAASVNLQSYVGTILTLFLLQLH